MSQHLDCRPVDPPGTENRRWKCLDCGRIDIGLKWVQEYDCTGPKKTDDQRLLDALEEGEP